MKSRRIRRNDGVWFNEYDRKKQGLVLETHEGIMSIILDGWGGKVTHTARRKDGKWYAFGYQEGDYALEVFKT